MADETPHQFEVTAAEAGTRLDRFCAGRLDGVSRTHVQSLNRDGGVLVNGRSRADSYAVASGDIVTVVVTRDPGTDAPPQPERIPIDVVFEDDDIVVVNKQAGLVVHPAHGNPNGTLVNALLGHGSSLASQGSPSRPGIVHRLDKDTSGLMVVAKRDAAYASLAAQIKDGRLAKRYQAIAHGHLGRTQMTVDAPIARHPVHRQRMAVVESGRPALTKLFVVDTYGHFDYIRVTTQTGRTHQIRVHLAHVGHPLLGDPVYGGRRKKGHVSNVRAKATIDKLLATMQRHALHASKLSFAHPTTGRYLSFRSALPEDMRLALEILYRQDRLKEV